MMSCELLAANDELIALFLADDQHLHDLFVRLNVEQNTIVALTQAVLLFAAKFFGACGSWVTRQTFDLCDDTATVFEW